jgi:hypothetical protein
MPYEETEAKLASYSLFGGWPMVRVYSHTICHQPNMPIVGLHLITPERRYWLNHQIPSGDLRKEMDPRRESDG